MGRKKRLIHFLFRGKEAWELNRFFLSQYSHSVLDDLLRGSGLTCIMYNGSLSHLDSSFSPNGLYKVRSLSLAVFIFIQKRAHLDETREGNLHEEALMLSKVFWMHFLNNWSIKLHLMSLQKSQQTTLGCRIYLETIFLLFLFIIFFLRNEYISQIITALNETWSMCNACTMHMHV